MTHLMLTDFCASLFQEGGKPSASDRSGTHIRCEFFLTFNVIFVCLCEMTSETEGSKKKKHFDCLIWCKVAGL